MEGEQKKVIKGPCCVCKETRLTRDECIREKGEEECQAEIEKQVECLASFGFRSEKKQTVNPDLANK
jgi:cytochrome c oxidase assembly protein subunit 17